MSTPYVQAPTVKVKALNCPGCGGRVEIRGFAHTLTVVCQNCLSTLDASDKTLRLLQRAYGKDKRDPLIALGSRARFENTVFEAIGYQVRGIEVEGVRYEWEEYVLFNPYQGFRYLTHYRGHWNYVTAVRKLPRLTAGSRPEVTLDGVKYKHFQHATSNTYYVVGEFPWQARKDDRVAYDDYVSPPFVLSSEITPQEVTWSQGRYMTGAEVFQAFGRKDSAPRAEGVFANQPSPFAGRVRSIWTLYLILIAITITVALVLGSSGRQVFESAYSYTTPARGETSFVTPVFELKGSRPLAAEVNIRADVSNNWLYLGMALINDQTGDAYDFGKEVSYYFGSDSDGSWSEGSQSESVDVPRVPPGRYYLRIEPDMEGGKSASVNYIVRVNYGTVSTGLFWLTAFLLLIPPVVFSIRAASFESTRWSESDHAPTSSDSDDSGDDE
ncbi:MAG: DUF4178 domain-containing protein [Bryobacteraceae bacterium]|nr:DUF4178 domain-containing protein [Bryobacteraceae bacterium]